MQKVEEMFAVTGTFLNFVNSLPFVLPKEEVTLVSTSRVKQRQRMHMAARHSKEKAEQWQQEPGGSSLSRDSC